MSIFLFVCLMPAWYGLQTSEQWSEDTSSVEDLATLLLAMHPSAGNTQLGKTRSSVPVSGVKERNKARSSLTETASVPVSEPMDVDLSKEDAILQFSLTERASEDGDEDVFDKAPAIKNPAEKVASSIYSTYKETGTLLGTDVGKVDTTGEEIPELKVLEEMQAFLEEEIPEEVSDLMLQALTIEMPVRPDASEMKELSMEEKRAYLNSQRLS
mmetsp:Transcript_83741/g.131880  ORF Transcript_83741/g.131880 Transcript_83741/m.131880 type:complete len:213 (+) Transcript_83741:64-702(+)